MQIGNNDARYLTDCASNNSRSGMTDRRRMERGFAEKFAELAETGQVQTPQSDKERCHGHSDIIQEAYARMTMKSPEAREDETDPLKYIRDYMADIYKKVQNNDCEPTFQIGAQTFTEKEWERFLKRFDSVEEAIQAALKEARGEEMTDTESTSIVNPEEDEWKKEDTMEGAAMAALCPGTEKGSHPTADADMEEKVNEDLRQAEQERETDSSYMNL